MAMKGPKFLKYLIPILDVLQENGGAGNSSSVIAAFVDYSNNQRYHESLNNGFFILL